MLLGVLEFDLDPHLKYGQDWSYVVAWQAALGLAQCYINKASRLWLLLLSLVSNRTLPIEVRDVLLMKQPLLTFHFKLCSLQL